MPNFAPTAEQQEIVNASLTGKNVVVKAGAGSGKTSTLKLIAEALPGKSIAYVAFNSAIAAEAANSFKPMSNVEARTAHSFAYRNIVGRGPFKNRLKAAKPSSRDVAAMLHQNNPLTYMVVELGQEHERVVKPSTIGYAATKMVERFCQSAENQIQLWHCPKIDGLDKAAQSNFAEHVLPLANRIWEDVSDPNAHAFKFDHCHYLKLYQLAVCNDGMAFEVEIGGVWTAGKYGEYRKGATARRVDVILYDEAQDANPVVQAIVAAQTNAQVIVVGDSSQAIYGFTGALNAMDKFDAEYELKLTKSFRFGHAIAEVANRLLDMLPDTDMQIVGHDPVPSEVVGLS